MSTDNANYIDEAVELLTGSTIMMIDPPSRVLVETEDGKYTAGVSDGWLKFRFDFRKRMLGRLKGAKLAVFLCICLHINEEGGAFPGINLICQETDYETEAVTKAIKELEEIPGLLDIVRSPGRVNHYYPAFAAYGKSVPTPPEKRSGTPPEKRSAPPRKSEDEVERTIKEEPSSASSGEKIIQGTTSASLPDSANDTVKKGMQFDCSWCGEKGVINYQHEVCPQCNARIDWGGTNKFLTKHKKNKQRDELARNRREKRDNDLTPGQKHLLLEASMSSPSYRRDGNYRVAFTDEQKQLVADWETERGQEFIMTQTKYWREQGKCDRGLIRAVIRSFGIAPTYQKNGAPLNDQRQQPTLVLTEAARRELGLGPE